MIKVGLSPTRYVRAFAGLDEVLVRAFSALDPAVDAQVEATRFAALLDGLRFRVLLGAVALGAATAIVDRHLATLGAT